MIVRILLAASLAAVALPATAQSVLTTHTENGAAAGRSPHKAYRPIATTSGCETKQMHSLPAGKLPVYGQPATPDHCRTIAQAGTGVAAGEQ